MGSKLTLRVLSSKTQTLSPETLRTFYFLSPKIRVRQRSKWCTDIKLTMISQKCKIWKINERVLGSVRSRKSQILQIPTKQAASKETLSIQK